MSMTITNSFVIFIIIFIVFEAYAFCYAFTLRKRIDSFSDQSTVQNIRISDTIMSHIMSDIPQLDTPVVPQPYFVNVKLDQDHTFGIPKIATGPDRAYAFEIFLYPSHSFSPFLTLINQEIANGSQTFYYDILICKLIGTGDQYESTFTLVLDFAVSKTPEDKYSTHTHQVNIIWNRNLGPRKHKMDLPKLSIKVTANENQAIVTLGRKEETNIIIDFSVLGVKHCIGVEGSAFKNKPILVDNIRENNFLEQVQELHWYINPAKKYKWIKKEWFR